MSPMIDIESNLYAVAYIYVLNSDPLMEGTLRAAETFS